MAAVTLRYTLEQIEDIIYKGFDYQVPDDVIEKISNLAMQVGSPDYVKTPIFKKRENPMKVEPKDNLPSSSNKEFNKKRRNKATEVFDDDWDTIRTFQTTKIESKSGIEADFDLIRSYINKMTDKNYVEMTNKIVEIIEKLVSENPENELSCIGSNIFEIASSNRYYSKIYAELYSNLSSKFEFIKTKYEENFNKFTELFDNIEYMDPNENYDKFCQINKINEKRKSLATFYMNLMLTGIISKDDIIKITRNLLDKVYRFISIENKKNEVEELTENVAILYKKNLYDENNNYELIEGFTINEIIEKIANSKVKDYKSLTNKSLFKFMDLVDNM